MAGGIIFPPGGLRRLVVIWRGGFFAKIIFWWFIPGGRQTTRGFRGFWDANGFVVQQIANKRFETIVVHGVLRLVTEILPHGVDFVEVRRMAEGSEHFFNHRRHFWQQNKTFFVLIALGEGLFADVVEPKTQKIFSDLFLFFEENKKILKTCPHRRATP